MDSKLWMMTIYPFDFDNEKLMTFRDRKNNIDSLVAKQEDFKSIDELEEYLVDCNIKKNIVIKEEYIRYYNVLPKDCKSAYLITEKEGYAFCNQGRGAKKVFVIERG